MSKHVCTNHDHSTTQLKTLLFLGKRVDVRSHSWKFYIKKKINSKLTNCFLSVCISAILLWRSLQLPPSVVYVWECVCYVYFSLRFVSEFQRNFTQIILLVTYHEDLIKAHPGNTTNRTDVDLMRHQLINIKPTSCPGFLPRRIHLHNFILLCRIFGGSDPLLLNDIEHAQYKGQADVCMDDALKSYWVIKCSAAGNAYYIWDWLGRGRQTRICHPPSHLDLWSVVSL